MQAHLLLALALDGLNRTPDAIVELESAERMAPNEPNLHFKLGYLYYRVRVYDRAVKEFQVEIDHDPSDAQAYTYLGDIALHRNDYSAAEPLLKKANALQPSNRLASFDLGVVYFEAKRYQAALVAFQRVETRSVAARCALPRGPHLFEFGTKAEGATGIREDQGIAQQER